MVANRELMKKRGLDEGDGQQIDDIHKVDELLVDIMDKNDTDTVEFWKALAQWRYNQALLQSIWRFPADPSMWQEYRNIPKCRCPQMDNKDMGAHIYFNGDCPIHWHEIQMFQDVQGGDKNE